MSSKYVDKEFDDIDEEIDSSEKLYQILTGKVLLGRKREIQKELKKRFYSEYSSKCVDPENAPNIDTNFDAENPGMFRCLWCKRIFKRDMGRLLHSYWCNWQPDKIEVMSRIRLSRKEASEQLMSEKKFKTDSDNLNKMPTTSKLRKNRAKLTKKRSSDDNYPSNGSSPQHPSTLPNSSPSHTTYYRTGAFEEIRAEFSRKRRKLNHAKVAELLRRKDLSQPPAAGKYDADINLLDLRIQQIEKENAKRKEIVSLREQNRIMKEKLAESENFPFEDNIPDSPQLPD